MQFDWSLDMTQECLLITKCAGSTDVSQLGCGAVGLTGLLSSTETLSVLVMWPEKLHSVAKKKNPIIKQQGN